MKVLRDGLIYDTEKLELLFNLDKDKPERKRESYSGNSSGSFSTPLYVSETLSGVSGASFTVNASTSVHPSNNKDYIYTNWIAKTPNKGKYVIISEAKVKTDTEQEVKVYRNILRWFENANEVRDYLGDRFGIDEEYDKLLMDFLNFIHVDIDFA